MSEKPLPLCAVSWCVSYCAFPSMYCVVHGLDKDLHPDYPGAGEVLTEEDDLLRGTDCEDCDGTGDTECESCMGDGDCSCSHCDSDHDCGKCEGLGTIECEACGGDGRKPATAGAPRYVNPWAFVKDGGTVTRPWSRRRRERVDEQLRWTPEVYEARRQKRARTAWARSTTP